MARKDNADPVRPRRRGRRLLISLVVLLLLVGALLAVADRVGARMAEDRIRGYVEQELAAREARATGVDVAVGGFPFLTQVVRGRYESVTIVLTDLVGAVRGDTVTLPRLDVEAREVLAPLDTVRTGRGQVTARAVQGTGSITYASVVKLIKLPDTRLAARDGRLAATVPVTVGGRQYMLRGEVEIAAVDGRIRLRVAQLDADELPDVPQVRTLVDNYARQLAFTVPLPALPFRLAVQEVRALDEGIAVTATATDVPLGRGA